jgi:hypothetical protein
LVELGFFFRGKRMHQKHAIAHSRFCVTTMGTDHVTQRMPIAPFPGKFIHLKRTTALRVGTSLKLHGWREERRKTMGEIFAEFILLQFP